MIMLIGLKRSMKLPEGPEVKKMGSDLAKAISNKTLTEIDVLSGRYIKKQIDGLPEFREVSPCLLYTSPSPRDRQKSRMPSSA